MPEAGVLEGDVLDGDVVAVVDEHAHGAGVVGAEDAGVLDAFDVVPPDLSLAVDGAASGDGDVVGVEDVEERLDRGLAHEGGGVKVGAVGGAEEHGTGFDIEDDAGFELERAGDELAVSELDGALFGGAGVDRFLYRGGVLGGAVALGAEGADVADGLCAGGDECGGEEGGSGEESLHGVSGGAEAHGA